MTYKLVPINPTREMWAAAGDAVVALKSQHHDAISEAVYKAMLTAAPDVANLVEALERLVLAAQCRDNSTGDQIRLIETRAELSAAAKNAEEVLSTYRKQEGLK